LSSSVNRLHINYWQTLRTKHDDVHLVKYPSGFLDLYEKVKSIGTNTYINYKRLMHYFWTQLWNEVSIEIIEAKKRWLKILVILV